MNASVLNLYYNIYKIYTLAVPVCLFLVLKLYTFSRYLSYIFFFNRLKNNNINRCHQYLTIVIVIIIIIMPRCYMVKKLGPKLLQQHSAALVTMDLDECGSRSGTESPPPFTDPTSVKLYKPLESVAISKHKGKPVFFYIYYVMSGDQLVSTALQIIHTCIRS